MVIDVYRMSYGHSVPFICTLGYIFFLPAINVCAISVDELVICNAFIDLVFYFDLGAIYTAV